MRLRVLLAEKCMITSTACHDSQCSFSSDSASGICLRPTVAPCTTACRHFSAIDVDVMGQPAGDQSSGYDGGDQSSGMSGGMGGSGMSRQGGGYGGEGLCMGAARCAVSMSAVPYPPLHFCIVSVWS